MLPSLDRKEGVDADDLILRISEATPGINRGSKAIPINELWISSNDERYRCCRFANMDVYIGIVYFGWSRRGKRVDY